MYRNKNNNWNTEKLSTSAGNLYIAMSSTTYHDNISSSVLYSTNNIKMEVIRIIFTSPNLNSIFSKIIDNSKITIKCKFDSNKFDYYEFKVNFNGKHQVSFELNSNLLSQFKDKIIKYQILKLYLDAGNGNIYTFGYFLRNADLAINSITKRNNEDIYFDDISFWEVVENKISSSSVNSVSVRFLNEVTKENIFKFVYVRKYEGPEHVNFIILMDSIKDLEFNKNYSNPSDNYSTFGFCVDDQDMFYITFYSTRDSRIWVMQNQEDIENLYNKLMSGSILKINGIDLNGKSFNFIYPLIGFKEAVTKAKKIVKLDNLNY